ncbi:hypothetical protein C5E41_22595 [Nocardia nova]|nr:hypothetical protein C5E41_22595 [Nocardia nova]
MGASADHRGAAGRAPHPPGQGVIGAIRAAVSMILAPLGQKAGSFGVGVDVDEWGVAVGDGDVAE